MERSGPSEIISWMISVRPDAPASSQGVSLFLARALMLAPAAISDFAIAVLSCFTARRSAVSPELFFFIDRRARINQDTDTGEVSCRDGVMQFGHGLSCCLCCGGQHGCQCNDQPHYPMRGGPSSAVCGPTYMRAIPAEDNARWQIMQGVEVEYMTAPVSNLRSSRDIASQSATRSACASRLLSTITRLGP